jgi:hypothetical protein
LNKSSTIADLKRSIIELSENTTLDISNLVIANIKYGTIESKFIDTQSCYDIDQSTETTLAYEVIAPQCRDIQELE